MRRKEQIQVQVKGFLTPIFTQTGPDGRTMNGLDPESFEMVRQGFACADCLAMFSAYTITCPVCGLSRDVALDVAQAPELWKQHIRERNEPWIGNGKPRPRNPLTAMDAVRNDKDVENIPLSKLRNTRKRSS